jgi:hypothetical protein
VELEDLKQPNTKQWVQELKTHLSNPSNAEAFDDTRYGDDPVREYSPPSPNSFKLLFQPHDDDVFKEMRELEDSLRKPSGRGRVVPVNLNNYAEILDRVAKEVQQGEGRTGGDTPGAAFPPDGTVDQLFDLANTRKGDPTAVFLPVLGEFGFLVKGYSTLLVALSKAGKSDLLDDHLLEWKNEKILYITEESPEVWSDRLFKVKKRQPADYQHVRWLYALDDSWTPDQLIQRMRAGSETLVIMDTVRNILSVKESSNEAVAIAMKPFVTLCRGKKQTFLPVHHERKARGEYGTAASGGNAWLGSVDRVIELDYEGKEDSPKRLLNGFGRNFPRKKMIYEKSAEGKMIVLGSPDELALPAVMERCLPLLSKEKGITLTETQKRIGKPVPSRTTLQAAYDAHVKNGVATRSPKEDVSGTTYRWRLK